MRFGGHREGRPKSHSSLSALLFRVIVNIDRDPPPVCPRNLNPPCEVSSVESEANDPREGGAKVCVVHIAETDEQKF